MTLRSDQDNHNRLRVWEAAVYRANVAKECFSAASHTYAASLGHTHTVAHVLDDLKGSVDAGGFGKGFVPFLAVVYLEYLLTLNYALQLFKIRVGILLY